MGYISDDTRKVTTHRLIEMKQRGEKISMLTSYDYTMAQIVDGAGVDVDSGGRFRFNVMAGMSPRFPSRARPDDLSWQIRGSRCEACHGHCRHAFGSYQATNWRDWLPLSVL